MNAAHTIALSPLERPVTQYWTRAAVTAEPGSTIASVAALMSARRVSCIPITDPRGAVLGVISRTDLVALGALQTGARSDSPAMPLPRRRAVDVMTTRVVTAPPTATVRSVARLMASHAIHHVVIVDAGILAGIISTIDIAAAVRDAQIMAPLSTVMSTPAITVDVRTPLGIASELLSRIRVSGVVVLADDKPVGTFTQAEALAARDLPRGTPLETIYEPALVCLPQQTSLWMAASQLVRLDVRRIVVCDQRSPVGVATSLDFARYVAW